ncbi:MAG: caspase family protein [Spirochaetes bacterium]|nr:caspase family protein [Spirochaetota bacterium]
MRSITFHLMILLILLVPGTTFGDDDIKMVLQTGNTSMTGKIIFSHDSSLFASLDSTGYHIRVWSKNGRLIQIFSQATPFGALDMVFSPDNKYLGIAASQKIVILNINSGKSFSFGNNAESSPYRNFYSLAFTADSKNIITGVSLNINLNLPLTMDIDFFNAVFSKSQEKGKKTLQQSYEFDEKSNIYQLRMDLDSYKDLYSSFITAGYKLNFLTDDRFRIRLEMWNLGGKFVRLIGSHSKNQGHYIRHVRISPDQKTVLSYGTDSIIKLWDLESGLINQFNGDNPNYVTNLDFSTDGKLLGWTTYNSLKVSNMNGIILKNLSLQSVPFDLNLDKRLYVTFTTKVMGENNWYMILSIKDLDGKVIGETQKIPTYLQVKMSPDTNFIAVGGQDGSMNLINRNVGQVVSMISNEQGEWLTYTHDGYWDASRNGGNLVAMVKDLDAFGVDQFAAQFNRPDIIFKRLGIEDPEMIQYYYYQYKKRLKRLGLTEEVFSREFHVPKATILKTDQKDKDLIITFKLEDSKYQLRKYNIYINDVPLYGAYGKTINGREVELTETVKLTTGKNKVELSCINEKGAEAFRALTYAAYHKKHKGDLYYIGFGVSDYKNPTINDLNYAHQDALDLEKTFLQLKKYYNQIYTYTFINQDASVTNIKKAKMLLQNASEEDTFVLFIAGHGLHDNDAENTYYYLTYEADLKNLAKTAANFDLIEDLLQGIQPRNKLFLMDTCESGEIEEQSQANYFKLAGTRGLTARNIERGIKLRKNKANINTEKKRTYLLEKDRYIYNDLLRRSGAIVFSSSKGGEFSYEHEKLKNGLFTEEVINALSNSAVDQDKDGMISVDELKKYVSQAVAQISDDLQHPTVDRDNIFQKFGFPITK